MMPEDARIREGRIEEEHTRVTDIIPTEGNIFQKVIDFLYGIGVK